MILQALHDLYDRFVGDPNYDVAPDGFSLQKISFVIVLNLDGTVHDIQDHRILEGKQIRPQTRPVLGGAKPSGSGLNPCFLWDNSSYLLGFKPDDAKPERTQKCFEASQEFHVGHRDELKNPAYEAVCDYFESWRTESALHRFPIISDISTGFGVFQIRGEADFVHDAEAIKSWWRKTQRRTEQSDTTATCLLTGQQGEIAELHQPKIKGVKDSQGAGALIVSFNTNAYESFGKNSGFNAPVSKEAASKYCKSLNALLASEKHRLQIGDATTVFWTEQETDFEECLGTWFSGPGKEVSAQDRERLGEIEGALKSIQKGGRPRKVLGSDSETMFYILGLTGQAGGRIGIRFWHHCTLGDLFEKLARHHGDLAIERQWGEGSRNPDPEFPRIWQLLRQTARESKDIPPNLGGALMRSILSGSHYPEMLAIAVMNRIRADREISYLRAAILKAWLTRSPNTIQGIDMSLNEDNIDPAYRLGRLFAALEKTQDDALGSVNAGIRDRFYSSASTTPGAVFPRLLRTYQHHLSKLDGGLKVKREQLIQEILDPLTGFPGFMNLQAQGLFAIGYYHQRKRFFTKRKDKSDAT